MGAEGRATSAVFAGRLEALRKRRGWTQQDLADRVADLGGTLSRGTIAKIESGVRKGGVTLDEAMLLSVALNAPLPLLCVPLEGDDQVALAPNLAADAWKALGWLQGEVPLSADPDDMAAWVRESAAFQLDARLRVAQQRLELARHTVRQEEYTGDEKRLQAAREGYVAALREAAKVLGMIADRGLTTPAVDPGYLADMDKLGIEHRRYFATAQEIREFAEWAGGKVIYAPGLDADHAGGES